MSRNAEWGGIIELYAYTEMFEVTTYVWEALQVDNGQTPRFALRHSLEGRHCASSRRDLGTMVQTVHLFYNGTNHYAVFVPDTPDATAHPQASPTLRGAGSAESAEPILTVAEEMVQDELADMIACNRRQKVVHAAWQVSMRARVDAEMHAAMDVGLRPNVMLAQSHGVPLPAHIANRNISMVMVEDDANASYDNIDDVEDENDHVPSDDDVVSVALAVDEDTVCWTMRLQTTRTHILNWILSLSQHLTHAMAAKRDVVVWLLSAIRTISVAVVCM